MKEVKDIIEWGQGYDDTILELLKAFKKFRDGYFELINWDDDWWKHFNQGYEFDLIMKEAWEKIDEDLMESIEIMAIAITGAYVNFNKMLEGVKEAYENGSGLRHKEEKKDDLDT
jgi:hypothetical protein